MYKSRLQELCQQRGWGLPEYTTSRTGPDHMARFTATVKLKGGDLSFETPSKCTSSKDAQNTAAHIAFDHIINNNTLPNINSIIPNSHPISPQPTSLPIPSLGLVATAKSEAAAANVKSGNSAEIPQNGNDSSGSTLGDSTCFRMSIGLHDKASKDALHMYKNRLQQYGQKNNLGFPVYTSEAEGPPHNRRFKSRVSLDRKSYETLEFFTTLKEAEQAAAKVACQMLSVDATQEDGSLYKNLLQELAQKMNLPCPSYETASCGMSHRPVFVSSVEVGSYTFRGSEAFTKKQAEMHAAKVAYLALTERCRAKESSSASSIASIAINDNLTQGNQSSDLVKQQRQCRDATYEEVQTHAKKSRLGDGTENTHSNWHVHDLPQDDPSLHSSPSESSSVLPLGPLKEQPVNVDGQTLPQVKTVVFPRKLNLPVPENAIGKPYSDERFVAYKIGLIPEADA